MLPIVFLNVIVMAVGGDEHGVLSLVNSPCEVLRQLDVYDARMVRVRAKVTVTDEAVYLADERCSGYVSVGSQELIAGIALARTGSRRPLKRVAPFRTDPASLEYFHSQLEKAAGRAVFVTMVGRLDTYPWREARRDGRILRYGFGHLNAFPAELVIRKVERVELR